MQFFLLQNDKDRLPDVKNIWLKFIYETGFEREYISVLMLL